MPAIERLVDRSGPLPPRLDWATVISALGAFVAVQDDRIAGVMVLWPHPDHVRIEAFTVLLAVGTGPVRLLPGAVTPGVLAFTQRHGFVDRDGVLEKRPV